MSAMGAFMGIERFYSMVEGRFFDLNLLKQHVEKVVREEYVLKNFIEKYFNGENPNDPTNTGKWRHPLEVMVEEYCEEAYVLGFQFGVEFLFNMLSGKMQYYEPIPD